jgi:hypothetical protein
MRLVEIMQSLGDRLGILEKPAETAQPTARLKTRSITLAELMSEIRSEQVRTLAEMPAELSVPFDQVYEAAGVKLSARAWNIAKLLEILDRKEFKDLDRTEIQKRIVTALNAEKVEIQDIVRDAVARDKALDAFEEFARKKLRDRTAARERRLAEIETALGELEKERATLREKADMDRKQWEDWRRRKRAAEHGLAHAVGYLIEGQVITTDEGEG